MFWFARLKAKKNNIKFLYFVLAIILLVVSGTLISQDNRYATPGRIAVIFERKELDTFYIFEGSPDVCNYIACTIEELEKIKDLEICDWIKIQSAIEDIKWQIEKGWYENSYFIRRYMRRGEAYPKPLFFKYRFRDRLPDGVYFFFHGWKPEDTLKPWYRNGKWKDYYTMKAVFIDSLRDGQWEYWYRYDHPRRLRSSSKKKNCVKCDYFAHFQEAYIEYKQGKVRGFFKCRDLWDYLTMGFISDNDDGFAINFLPYQETWNIGLRRSRVPDKIEIYWKGRLHKTFKANSYILEPVDTAEGVFLAVDSNVLDTTLRDESPVIPWMVK
ncbi:MAG: hypothetical protein GXO48_00365 [Chlorobi bacterium]|nr:hypothetical protein [Chlorobiota bacterium]